MKRFDIPNLSGLAIIGVLFLSGLPAYLLSSHGHFVLAIIYFLFWPLILNIELGLTIEIASFIQRRIGRNGPGE